MKVGFVRPRVADLVFQLFGRPLHPELFEVFASRQIRRDNYEATIQITDTSHTITWRTQEVCLAEVTASADHPLPRKRRLLLHTMRSQRSDVVQCAGGAVYRVSFQVEQLEPAVFWHIHDELAQEGTRRGLLHQFQTSDRIKHGPLSYLNVEPRGQSLLVHAFHTFPDEFSVVKTQSLFELGQ